MLVSHLQEGFLDDDDEEMERDDGGNDESGERWPSSDESFSDDDDDDGTSSEDDDDNDDHDDDEEDEDDDSFDSDMDVEARSLWDALQPPQEQQQQQQQQHQQHQQHQQQQHPPHPQAATPPTREQILREALTAIRDSKTTAFKLDDGLISFLRQGEYGEDPNLQARVMAQLTSDLLSAIIWCNEIRHVILGTTLLQLMNSSEAQTQLYQTLITSHSRTITYWKLGSNDSTECCGIPTTELLQAMNAADWPALTECQVRGLALNDRSQIDGANGIVTLLKKLAPTIKLFNWLGLVLSPPLLSTPGLFDPFWAAVEPILPLDEVQLQINVNTFNTEKLQQDTYHHPQHHQQHPHYHQPQQLMPTSHHQQHQLLPPLVSHAVLEHLLQVKPKWWRISLDGCGLDDQHLEIIGHALKTIKDCKMNDLLSIRDNPKITSKGLSQLYHVCLNKQRMGLVHSDDPSWVATFDLVRPLNNLHRRLEYKTEDEQLGVHSFRDVPRWLEWFQVLSNLPWIDETRKLNYIWFTLLEQPEMIQSAILQVSSN